MLEQQDLLLKKWAYRTGDEAGRRREWGSMSSWMVRNAFILLTLQNERLHSSLPTPEMFVTKTTSFSEVGGDSHFTAALKFTSHSSSRPPPVLLLVRPPQKHPLCCRNFSLQAERVSHNRQRTHQSGRAGWDLFLRLLEMQSLFFQVSDFPHYESQSKQQASW